MGGMDLTSPVRRWLAAWTVARGLAPAVAVPGGFRVTLGLPGRHHEFMAPDPDGLPALTAALKAAEPSWLTVFTTDPAGVEVALKAEGLEFFTEPETFMRATLHDRPKRLPANGYGVATTTDGALVRATVTAPDGTVAASGLMAVAGTDAVAHAIHTDEAHRRRGLGGAVMTALGEAATARGATTGLLIASAAGAGLYRSLGWESVATVVSVRA